MTERFYISGVGISDRERKRLYDLQTVDGFISVRDLLNELNDENEQLKKELESFKPIIFESDRKPVTLYKKGDLE